MIKSRFRESVNALSTLSRDFQPAVYFVSMAVYVILVLLRTDNDRNRLVVPCRKQNGSMMYEG